MAAATPRPAPRGLLKRIFVGRALTTDKQEHQLLPKFLALPVFSSDALSSNAYATEEMMLVLSAAGATALSLMLPIGLAIAVLLAIVVASYRQTVHAYPRGGGSYIVSKENLGTVPGLVAAAAILSDYILTVAVSVTAGTVAVISAAPGVAGYRVEIALGFLLLVTLANLRGAREAGTVFAVPTYGFVAMVAITLVTGAVRCLGGCPVAETASLNLEPQHALSLFLILRAFSSGATALTGVEAIADGVQAFRRPQPRNAASTLAIMGAISVTMFIGITMLARGFSVRVSEDLVHQRSVLAQIGHTAFGGGLPFIVLQVFTAGILVLAANTAFQDFPRLSAILARDRFMPSQFRNRGDRLVFSNGIVVLAALAGLLIWTFDANLNRLIQLYVVGVFTAFTLSQAGMVRRWFTLKAPRWKHRAVINGIGAATTGIVLVIVTITKFSHGAWIVLAAMPVIVGFFLAVHHHYEKVGRALRVRAVSSAERPANTFLVLVSDLGPELLDAVRYLRGLRPEEVIPLFIGSPDRYEEMALEWTTTAPRLGKLELLVGADERLGRAVKRYIRTVPRAHGDFVTVVIPEALTGRSWLQFLRSRRGLVLKSGLLFEPGVVVTDVPLLPEERGQAASYAEHPTEMVRHVVLVPVSAVHDATVRAVVYARALKPALVEAIVFVTEPDEVGGIVDAWRDRALDVPLVLVEAPFRDLGIPLLGEVRKHTAHRDTMVTVVLPELIPAHWWENLLHNQTAFYIKRLLLFEPSVVVSSVPFHLRTVAIEIRDTEPAGSPAP